MASQLNSDFSRATARAALPAPHNHRLQNPHFIFTKEPPDIIKLTKRNKLFSILKRSRIHVSSSGGDSYLDMWEKAVDRDRKSKEFERIAEKLVDGAGEEGGEEEVSQEELERKSNEFQKILEVSNEERDRIQRMQVVDRAAAAIAAARALLKENKPPKVQDSSEVNIHDSENETMAEDQGGEQNGTSLLSLTGGTSTGTPGPNFWSWTPPSETDDAVDGGEVKLNVKAFPDASKISPVMEKERSADYLLLPFESKIFQSKAPLPPLQSLAEVEELEVSSSTKETAHLEEEHELGIAFSTRAVEAVQALHEANEVSSQGFYPDKARWWKETGVETRPDGVVCKWTLTRGVSSDKAVEWEEKYWEAADEFGYKELGSEKSGRDAAGNVWREYWRESLIQNGGAVELEKTADKWGKNGKGDEWQEQWWEHYGASGTEKWAHKWCSIDPSTPLEDGHAHVWHERWGEKYDGQGGSTKYTDKWAERFQGDGWDKWGDKWDENFDPNAIGVKQGETWWQGKHGDRWNRTWGEHHNSSGWVHKYGKSSSGEHWDTRVQQDTWYERFPHYGFYHCFENSVQLREVKKPSEWS